MMSNTYFCPEEVWKRGGPEGEGAVLFQIFHCAYPLDGASSLGTFTLEPLPVLILQDGVTPFEPNDYDGPT